jgi:DNA-binding transcriptional ArsR family regulator
MSPDVFNALAHPVRRSLLDTLAAGEMPVNQLAEQYQVSRPAISQHLHVLLDAGLVEGRRDGRTNRYALRPEGFIEVHEWLTKYERFWRERMTRLGRYLEQNPARRPRPAPTRREPPRRKP